MAQSVQVGAAGNTVSTKYSTQNVGPKFVCISGYTSWHLNRGLGCLRTWYQLDRASHRASQGKPETDKRFGDRYQRAAPNPPKTIHSCGIRWLAFVATLAKRLALQRSYTQRRSHQIARQQASLGSTGPLRSLCLHATVSTASNVSRKQFFASEGHNSYNCVVKLPPTQSHGFAGRKACQTL